MEKRDVAEFVLMTLIFTLGLLTFNEGLRADGWSDSFCDTGLEDRYYSDSRHDFINNYSSPDYSYDYNSLARYRRIKNDNDSGNFSAGISSYQGTSTGPGPNGGYPGSPRGVYRTHYFNTKDNSDYYFHR
jgi:hypothetical protein